MLLVGLHECLQWVASCHCSMSAKVSGYIHRQEPGLSVKCLIEPDDQDELERLAALLDQYGPLLPFDFILVWLLYAALRTANESILTPSSVVDVCWLMLATKLCAIGWEALGSLHADKVAKKLALASDVIPLLGYAGLIFLYNRGAAVPDGVVKLLSFVVIVDAALYWVHEPIYKALKGRKRAEPPPPAPAI